MDAKAQLEPTFIRESFKIPSATRSWNLDAWSFRPEEGPPRPTVVMAHGGGCNKLMGLSHFAEAFASAGYACIVFDYRRWGRSDGTRRDSLFISEQLEDYRTVVRYVRSNPEHYDSQRVILWGFSVSGGHVMTLSAEQGLNISATIAISPYGGRPSNFTFSTHFFKMCMFGVWDFIKQFLGLPPFYIPAFANPGQIAAVSRPEGVEGLNSIIDRPGDCPNRIAASVFLRVPFYKAYNIAHLITCPILFVAPRRDTICSFDLTMSISDVPPRGELLEIAGGHFDMFHGNSDWDKSMTAQLEFLRRSVSL